MSVRTYCRLENMDRNSFAQHPNRCRDTANTSTNNRYMKIFSTLVHFPDCYAAVERRSQPFLDVVIILQTIARYAPHLFTKCTLQSKNYHRVFLTEHWLVRTRFSEKKCGEGRIVLAWASLHEDASLIKPMKCPLHSSSIVLRAGTS